MTEDRGGAGLEAELDALYSAPLEEFITRRDLLAKRLRAAGETAESGRVKALRKPTAVAWAINRLHLESNGLAEVEEVGRALRAALRNPRSTEERRAAIESRRRALERATAAVVSLLEGAGSSASPALLRRIERTLLAVATGAGAGPPHPNRGWVSGEDAPVPGRLHQELEPPGFEAILDEPAPAVAAAGPWGFGEGGARPASAAKAPAATPTPAKRPSPSQPPRAAAAPPARATSRPAPAPAAAPTPVVRAIARDSKEIRAARAALDRAEGELERATDRVDAARVKVTDAEKALAVARQQVDAERRELAAVRSRRDQARRELDRVKR